MTIRTKRVLGWLTIGLLALAAPALADHHEAKEKGAAGAEKSAKMDPSPEDRAKMAAAHEQMAACLRSSRPMKECRDEMKKACTSMHGKGGCGMGHHGHHGKGHEHGASDMTGADATKTKGKPEKSTTK